MITRFKGLKKFMLPIMMWMIFEIVAITLWLTMQNIFYLFNFSYIGASIAIGFLLFQFQYKYARRIAQFLVGAYMLVYLGLMCNENMQMEGFWYYLFTAVQQANPHHPRPKIKGPNIFATA